MASMHQFHRNLAWGLFPGQTQYRLIRSWDETNWNESDAIYRQRDWVRASRNYDQSWGYPDNTALHYQVDLLGWNPGDAGWTWQEHETVVPNNIYQAQIGPVAQARIENAQALLSTYIKNLPIPDLSALTLGAQQSEPEVSSSGIGIAIGIGVGILALGGLGYLLLKR